jgi:hypothetical protein
MGLRLILDLNLVANSPGMAARWAGAALAQLPRGSLVGFEIGNEPDLYGRVLWSRLVSVAPMRLGASISPRAYSSSSYVKDFSSYEQALERIAPSVPVVGPSVANPDSGAAWLSSLIAGEHHALGMVTAHRYPLSACNGPRSPRRPTIARLLSESTSAGMAHTVRGAVRLAHGAGLPFRLTELNSVTCGGLRGVSNTFATALWAPDALFELLQAGVDGVNVHIRARAINAPFTLTGKWLTVHPLLYGLILFSRTLGPHAQLVPLRLHAKRSLHIKVWGVRLHGNRLHVLVIDKSPRAAQVDLRLPGSGPATVQRLLAPSVASQSGVTLAGQQLGRSAAWQGPRRVETIVRGRRGYELTMLGMSAALVSVRLRPVAVAHSRAPRRAVRRGRAHRHRQ